VRAGQRIFAAYGKGALVMRKVHFVGLATTLTLSLGAASVSSPQTPAWEIDTGG